MMVSHPRNPAADQQIRSVGAGKRAARRLVMLLVGLTVPTAALADGAGEVKLILHEQVIHHAYERSATVGDLRILYGAEVVIVRGGAMPGPMQFDRGDWIRLAAVDRPNAEAIAQLLVDLRTQGADMESPRPPAAPTRQDELDERGERGEQDELDKVQVTGALRPINLVGFARECLVQWQSGPLPSRVASQVTGYEVGCALEHPLALINLQVERSGERWVASVTSFGTPDVILREEPGRR